MTGTTPRSEPDPVRQAAIIAVAAVGLAIGACWGLRRMDWGGWIPDWGRLAIAGIVVDLTSLGLIWYSSRNPKGPLVALPGVGWLLYSIACITAPRALLWNRTPAPELGTLAFKLAEFGALTAVHWLLQFGIPTLFIRKSSDP